jgi:glutamyl-tRNA(Gln) amidotransferase subunit D
MKLGWVLGHTDDHGEVLKMMRDIINHEITAREPHNAYLILQGGLPETDDFVRLHWK